jgi:hypothetical protein
MPIDLTVGATDKVSIKTLKDLEHEALSEIGLGAEFAGHLDQPISALPPDLRVTELSYASGNQSWKPGDFTFTLSGGVTGKMSVLTSGNLMDYTDEFASEITVSALDPTANKSTKKSIAIAAGTAYVAVELDLSIAGGVSGKWSDGIYGVSGSVSTTDTFAVTFCKQCKPADMLREALTAAFAGFVLPLHAETYAQLEPGDYLHHTLNAKLQVGLGASIGVDKVLYAGQYASDVPGTAGALQVSTPIKPEVKAEADLAFKFDYAGTFEALLWKTDANTGHMHLYRSSTQDVNLGLNLGVTFDPGACPSGKVMTTQLNEALAGVMPGSSSLAAKVLPAAEGELTSGADDGNKKVAAWLKKEEGAHDQASLDFAIGSTKSTFLLMDYTFDLTAAAFTTAWKLALGGKFVDALGTSGGGVSIAIGSGLENFYSQQTSVTLNLFGKLKESWTESVIDNCSMVYAGDNTFHLMADVGRESLNTIGKSKGEVDFYFAAEAALNNGSVSLQPVNLHLRLQATDDSKFGMYIAQLLGSIPGFPGLGDMAQAVAAMATKPGSTELLHVVIAPGTYGTLKSSRILNHKPDNEAPDRANYMAFAAACSDLIGDGPTAFNYQNQRMDYGIWRNWNIASNDAWPAPDGSSPNRTQAGNGENGEAQLHGQFKPAGPAVRVIAGCLQAGSNFMNFCEALESLALLPAAEPNLDSWQSFVAQLKSIIVNDTNQDFAVPATLALLRLCRSGPPDEVKGPAPGMAVGNSIAVTLTYK